MNTKFKQTEIGEIPEEWDIKPIPAIAQIISGGTPQTTNTDYWNGEIPWLSVVDFNNQNKHVYVTEKSITEEGLKNSSTAMLKKDMIIISARGTVGALAQLGKDMAFNQSCYGLSAKEDLTNDYLYYALKNNINSIKQKTHGSVFSTITRDTFNEIYLPVPDIDEQLQITSILSSLDDKIELNRKMNNSLEEMAKALFKHWFVECISKNWDTQKVEQVVEVKGGTKRIEFWNGDIYWTSPRDLSNKKTLFLINTERKITKLGLEEVGSGLLPIGTVLLSSRAPIGYLAITDIPVAINQGYIAILCNKGISNYYIYFWLLNNMARIISLANGSTFLEISKSTFKQIDFIKPPDEKLAEFDSIVRPIFSKIKKNEYEINTLSQIRDLLLPRLMSGIIRVK